jgi:hypothetical protein
MGASWLNGSTHGTGESTTCRKPAQMVVEKILVFLL